MNDNIMHSYTQKVNKVIACIGSLGIIAILLLHVTGMVKALF